MQSRLMKRVFLNFSAAENVKTGEKCAIKKVRFCIVSCFAVYLFNNINSFQVNKLFERPILTKRALRELKLLEHFNGHKNVRRFNKTTS